MLQRALAPGERLGAREPSKGRTILRAFVDRSLRLLRSLGEFFAAGGPLS